MADEIPKHPNPDETLREVLRTVKFQNESGNDLISFQVRADKVVLTFG